MEPSKVKKSVQLDMGPVWGCILIGGKSVRMGTPKHLLERDGATWLELIASKLRERVEQVVISGQGVIPGTLQDIPIVEDVEGVQGPLAGLLAVFRKYPGVSWLVAACDMPDIEIAALDWLLEQRIQGVKAILPDLNGDGHVEPLLAYYDRGCRELLEKIITGGGMRPGALVGEPGVITPVVPVAFHSSWENINFPENTRG